MQIGPIYSVLFIYIFYINIWHHGIIISERPAAVGFAHDAAVMPGGFHLASRHQIHDAASAEVGIISGIRHHSHQAGPILS